MYLPQAIEKLWFNLNILTVKDGLRRLGRLEFFNYAQLVKYERVTMRSGLTVQRYRPNVKEIKDPSGEYLLYFSKSRGIVKRAIELHHLKDLGFSEQNKELGKLYGYPNCCIDFFIKGGLYLAQQRIFNFLKKSIAYSKSKFPFLMNKFTLNPFIFHMPCGFNCDRTLKLVQEHVKLARKINAPLTDEILKNLKAVVLIAGDSAISIPGYRIKKEMIIFNKENFKESLSSDKKRAKCVWAHSRRSTKAYLQKKEMNRMEEREWREILSSFEQEEKYKIPFSGSKNLEVLIFD